MSLRDAAQAVVDRWDSPLWKDVPATAEYINRLKEELAAAPKVEQDPFCWIDEYGNREAEFRPWMKDEIDLGVKWVALYLAPPTPQIPQEWKDAVKMAIDALESCINDPKMRHTDTVHYATQDAHAKLCEVLK